MHIQTHLMFGWCAADLFDLTPRERLLCVVAAAAADLDGLGIVASWDRYTEWHHVLGHNALVGLLLSATLAMLSTHRLKGFCLYLALFHLHLVLDYYGSGPGWGISYLWPFSDDQILCPDAWELSSWQNLCAAVFLLTWTIVIAARKRRTPLEVILPALDRKIASAFRRKPDQ